MECPSCGRFTGPYQKCPYCGARLQGRVSLRVLKIAALVLAVAGLAGLWFAATRVPDPLVQIGQVGGMMNMAYVRIEGRVTKGPDYDAQTESLAFWVADDSGELRVAAYRNETRDLIAQGKIPTVGDQVSVVGNLRIREDFTALYLNVPDKLVITRPAPEEAAIGEITPLDIGRRVRVRGQVRQVYEPYAGLKLITLRDAGGEIEVAVGEVLEQLTGPLPAINVGDALEVVAAVTLYRDTPQLVPAASSDVVPAAGTAIVAPRREVGTVTSAEVGQWIQVEGEIVDSDAFSSGVRFTLDDGSGQIELLLWQSLFAQVPYSDALGLGARVRVQGQVAEYKGVLEVVPDVPQDLAILVAAPPPEEVTVAQLSPAEAGRIVTLRGVLGPGDYFSQGVRYSLDDGTGEIVLLLWSNVAEQSPEDLGHGAEVRVTGEVAEYKGEMEVVPRRGSDLEVLGHVEIAVTPVSQITAGDEGAVFTVEGTLGEGEKFSMGWRFPLRDDSGAILLLLWQNVLDAFPRAGELAAGARVRITGEIAVYRDTLEIVPEAGGILILP